MGAIGPYLRSFDGGKLGFWCPGCEGVHALRIRPADRSPSWEYNGNPAAPTFRPSVLVTVRWSEDDPAEKDEICHSFVTDGQIQFLGDCTHKLAGQTVPLPEFRGEE